MTAPVSVATPAAGERTLRLPLPPEQALALLADIVATWGADWEPKLTTLCLPVQAGLRHGLLTLRIDATPAPGGSDLRLTPEGEQWHLHRQAVAILTIAGLAAVLGVLWPFLPALASLAPLALVFGVSAWLFILSRLKNRGLGELLAQLETAAKDQP